MKLQAPNGKDVVGTLETVTGIALINSAEECQTGGESEDLFGLDYEGTTDIEWDEQKTSRNEDGRRIFVDSNGMLWPENELVLVED